VKINDGLGNLHSVVHIGHGAVCCDLRGRSGKYYPVLYWNFVDQPASGSYFPGSVVFIHH